MNHLILKPQILFISFGAYTHTHILLMCILWHHILVSQVLCMSALVDTANKSSEVIVLIYFFTALCEFQVFCGLTFWIYFVIP